MINFEKFVLENGLSVIVHQDKNTPVAAVNLLYDVGSRDEDPKRTGFAHLFEHLMFGGSINIPSFDSVLQQVGGENNAFTNSNITNYYITLPKENLETAFWLESDRMLQLDFTQKNLDIQKNVVIEEFNQRYLNQPYGDIQLLMKPLAYKVHPYQWPAIGKNPEHIANATLEEVKDFFYKHYAPNNAILTVAGNVDIKTVKNLAEKWFAPLPKREIAKRDLPQEPKQIKKREKIAEKPVPFDAIYKSWHMCGRNHPDYHATDLISDMLGTGKSSRLYHNLVQEQQLFSDITAFITGDHDPGLIKISASLMKSTTTEQAEEAIDKELVKIKNKRIDDKELIKVKNRIEFMLSVSEMNVLHKAINLSMAELLGDAADINHEIEKYRAVSEDDILRICNEILTTENSSVLKYHAIKK